MTEITFVIDRDHIAFNKVEKEIYKIMKKQFVKKIVLYESSTQKGYHIEITTSYNIFIVIMFTHIHHYSFCHSSPTSKPSKIESFGGLINS